MEKDFDPWNKLKKTINARDDIERVYFHEGDIWWVRLGVNVGSRLTASISNSRGGGPRHCSLSNEQSSATRVIQSE